MKNPLQSLTHRERAGLAVAVGVLVLFGIGSAAYRSQALPLQPTAFPTATPRSVGTPAPKSTPAPAPTPTPSAPLIVYVSGAVKKPGIYRFWTGQRLFQAIEKAGGFTRAARQDALNLAAYLKDAEQIHVPQQQDPERALPQAAPQSRPEAPQTPQKLHTPKEGKIGLNTATLDELQRLPGVGPSTAQRILEYRKSSGGFQELDQLKEVQGIGEKKFARMEPFLKL